MKLLMLVCKFVYIYYFVNMIYSYAHLYKVLYDILVAYSAVLDCWLICQIQMIKKCGYVLWSVTSYY